MGIHTPIDRRFRFGELYGIRKSYSDMNRSIEESNMEKRLFDMMMSHMIESGNLEKIERFAKKNAALRDFAMENSVVEAVSVMNERTEGEDIPRIIRKRAESRLRDVVEGVSHSIDTDEYTPPPLSTNYVYDVVCEADDDGTYTTEHESEEIDKLINDIAVKRGIVGNEEIIQSKSDREFEKRLGSDGDFAKKHNYSIKSVIIEAIAGNEKKTSLIPPTMIYGQQGDEPKDYLNSTMKNVVNGINTICGLNFPEEDYTWLYSGRPVPFLKAEMVVTADMVKGNRLLNAYFGPTGEFKDYLYRADGTPRIEQSKAMSMSTIDREVNAIMSYPIIRSYTTLISWDVVNGDEVLREISDEDFRGTSIRTID